MNRSSLAMSRICKHLMWSNHARKRKRSELHSTNKKLCQMITYTARKSWRKKTP